jgi:hypothetical protein|tara:strand:+ start:387 stop:713 length:327 start_codon:yes stop_codon:yes gene_type:complete
MAEKTGHLVKLKHEFPTEAVLEVSIKGNWYRTSSKDFRSFDGPRRYTKPIKQPGLGDSMFDVPMETISYNGPVYMYDTNSEVDTINEEKIVTSPYWEQGCTNSNNRGK